MKKTSIGGQALIEGVMMRGPTKIAIAVRKPDQNITTKIEDIKTLGERFPVLKLPILRGMVGLVESMFVGVKALMYSASFWEEEEEMTDFETFGVVLTSILISVGVFMILPNLITSFVGKNIDSVLALNLIEGVIRLSIFGVYLYYVSKLEDIQRIFEYHGAEHKTIHAYEAGESLTVENVKKYPIEHKRCGTSFLFMVMIVSILVLSFFGWPNPLMRIITRILALPIIAGISYEINKILGRSDSKFCNTISKGGTFIQRVATVREPDEEQIEVAIASLLPVLPKEGEDDSW